MNQQRIKKIKKIIRKRELEMRIEATKHFIKFCYEKSFFVRLQICWKILFKKVKV
jgi:hypothetical protein